MKPSTNFFPNLLLTLTAICSMAFGAFVMSTLIARPLHAADKQIQKINLSNEDSKTVEKKIKIGDFSQIKAGNAVEVIYTQGKATGEAIVSAPQDWLQALYINSSDDVLTIKCNSMDGQNFGKATVMVTSPELNYLEVATAASFTATTSVTCTHPLTIDSSSAADISFGELILPSLTVNAESASSVSILSVDSGKIDVNATSASIVKIKEISAPKVTAKAQSAAEISLSGRCNDADISTNSGGEVKSRGLIRETMPISPRINNDKR